MPNKSLSVATTEDQETYAAGEQMAARTGRSMSQFVIHLVRQAVDQERGMSILRVTTDGERKAFRGRWIIEASLPEERGIAETAKGNIVVYASKVLPEFQDLFEVYNSWDEIEPEVRNFFKPGERDTASDHFYPTPLLDI